MVVYNDAETSTSPCEEGLAARPHLSAHVSGRAVTRRGVAAVVANAETCGGAAVRGTGMCPVAVRRSVAGRSAHAENGSVDSGVSRVDPGPKVSKDYEGSTKGE